MSTFKEQRRHPRYEIRGIGGTLRCDVNARVLNLSLDGMALETSAWLHVGQSYRLKIGAGDDVLRINGKVTWCHLTGRRKGEGGGAAYEAGIHFEEALSDKGRHLLSFVRRAGEVGLSQRLLGRFKLRREEAVDVAFEHRFEVRRVSLSGLLLEADLLLEEDTRYVLELETPAGAFSPTVRVRSVEQASGDGGQPTFHIGVEFIDLADSDRAVVQELIEHQMTADEAPAPGEPEDDTAS